MDGSWQIKCSSTWQPSATPLLSSSSTLPSQAHRNQIEAIANQSFHPFGEHGFSFTDSGVTQQPIMHNNLDLSASQSGKPDMANSFLALLSGSSPQLQCEFQQSSSKSAMTTSKLPEYGSNIVASGAHCGVPISPIMPFNQRLHNGNMENAAEFVPSRTASTTNYGCTSYLRDNFQVENFNLQGSNSTSTGFDRAVCRNDRGMNLRQGHPSANPGNSCLFKKATIDSSPKFSSESKAVMLDSPSAFMKGHPLVFCLGKTGSLLLSNTGLLGVVCLCHNLHMSIAKFCGHSGLRVVNPGDAVFLESGESVSQWRRLYFQKLGIRVPDEHSEWDWPEEFSATGGLVKCGDTVPNMSTKADMSLPVEPGGGIATCGQTRNSLVSPRNPRTGRSVVEKPANIILHNAWQRNAQEGHNLVFDGLIGTSNIMLPTSSADGQIMTENHFPRGWPMPNTDVNVGRQDSGYRSISEYIDLLKAGNPFTSNPSLESSKSSGIVSDARRFNGSLEGFVVGKTAVSSNVELKLGQPSQNSHRMGSSVLSTVGPQPFNSVGDSQKTPYQGHVICNMVNPWVTEVSRPNISCMPLDTSNLNQREAESQLDFRNHALGSGNAINAVELSNGDVDKNSLTSMFFQHFRPPPEGAIQSQTANNMVNRVEHFLPRVPSGESHVAKSDPANLNWSRSNGTQKQLSTHWLGLHNHIDKGKGIVLADNCPKFSVEGSSTFQGKNTTDSSPFNGVISGYSLPSSSAVLSSSYLGLSPGMLPDANKPSNPNVQVPFSRRDGLDHPFVRSVHSFPVNAGPGIPLSTTSVGASSPASIFRPSPTPPLINKESSDANQQLLDENLRLLLLRHVAELSKQEHEIAFQEMNQDRGRLHNPTGMEVQRKCSFQAPLISEQLREGIYQTMEQDASEVKPLQSCSNCGLPGGIEKLADLTGTNSWCSFSTVATQGSALCSKDLGIQCPSSQDPIVHKHPVLRLGRHENKNIAASGDHAKCFHKELQAYFPGKCSCCVHSKCLAGSVSRGESSVGAYKEHTGSIDGKNSLLFASAFDKADVRSCEKVVGVSQCKNVRKQISVNEDCSDIQWNDISCRVMGVHNGNCIRMPAEELNGRENVDQFVETASRGYIGASFEAEPHKEQQMSNICSGCSAPAVTEVSMEVNNMDSSTVDAGYVTDQIVDEGSGVEKCWSSDDALDSGRSVHTPLVTTKVVSTRGGSSLLPTQSSNADEINMRKQLRLKRVSNQNTSVCAVHDNINHVKQFQRVVKTEKKKKVMKWRSLDASFPPPGLSSVQFKLDKCAGRAEPHSCSSKEVQFSSQLPACGHTGGSSSLKRKRSSIASSKVLTRKRSLQGLDVHHRGPEDEKHKQLKEGSNLTKVPKLLGVKKAKWLGYQSVSNQFHQQDMSHMETDKASKYSSVGCMKSFSIADKDTSDKISKPIVCGNSGIIFNAKVAEGLAKPPKIVSLSMILKKSGTGRCTMSENKEIAPISKLEKKKSKLRSKGCKSKLSILKKERDNGSKLTVINDDLEHGNSMTETNKACFSRNGDWDEPSMSQNEEDDDHTKCGDLHSFSAPAKPRFKETRRRSLHELTRRGKNPGYANFCGTKVSKYMLQTKYGSDEKLHLEDAEGSQESTGELCHVNAKKSVKDNYLASASESSAFCCVCGSSNKDEMNYLLECSCCSIRVHQACYGVTKVPKGRWSCRPCRTGSEHIACVLCGYEGGAMTRAIRSKNVVRSLLKVWNTSNISASGNSNRLSKALQDESRALDALVSVHEADLVTTLRPKNSKLFPKAAMKMDIQSQMDDVNMKDGSSSTPRVHNTVTAGVLDPTIMQWVHMVCGLWTPGTRCPNVDTMSAFDVSGAQGYRKNVVCSMCKRLGGSCIRCRVADCSVQFHPWCAHQKGLLQSEVEGVDNEKVGFYGRCELHAAHHKNVCEDHLVDIKTESPEHKDTSCARTEGYKGRKRDGFTQNQCRQSTTDNGGCLVPQEQINAWLHINGQKSSTRGFLKPPASDVEYDCRKEYARYKQAKGWKHLVVYKSGIHALGLYTSRFISRGSMVVEYVGEIVGLRVADKRENDYQSGRKLQYKSACYFFRIDKEHIIDATRKGGIARFVNHSCLPNCVAKIISVRNEKKVVFFAERDINPGEEITYDYHFNHEDEGKKIPCFCKSKNCRRYLN